MQYYEEYGTDRFFKDNNYIKSDNNIYWMPADAKIFREDYEVSEKDDFIEKYKKDANSVFNFLEVDDNILDISKTSNNIKEIRKLFGIEEKCEHIGGMVTCTQKATCQLCGVEYGDYDKNNHSKETIHIVNYKKATCIEEGYSGDIIYDCCDKVKEKGMIIKKTQHQYDDGKVIKESTYEIEGEKTFTCEFCNDIKTEIIPKLNDSNENDNNNNDNENSNESDNNNNVNSDENGNNNNNNENSNESGNNDNANVNSNENHNNKDNNIYNEQQGPIDNTCSSDKLPQTGIKSQIEFWLILLILIILAMYYAISLKYKYEFK